MVLPQGVEYKALGRAVGGDYRDLSNGAYPKG